MRQGQLPRIFPPRTSTKSTPTGLQKCSTAVQRFGGHMSAEEQETSPLNKMSSDSESLQTERQMVWFLLRRAAFQGTRATPCRVAYSTWTLPGRLLAQYMQLTR